jgi:hypothetical protein
VQSVSNRVAPQTWTAEFVTRDGGLPDLHALARAVRAVGGPFTLRGVEATIDGTLEESCGRLALRIPDTGQLLYLAPLEHKIQWDPRRGCEQPATAEERSAYDRLVGEWRQQPGRVEVVGPLAQTTDNRPSVLEVRQFTWGRG